ncbi:hypothetical protein J32TS6_16140 [Virgibacillus pantothenticus]|nr:hypothetical protein J32TS6_16140 [Virgibacillus pantothenticus]
MLDKENKSTVLNVKLEGAKGDGTTDDTLTFTNFRNCSKFSSHTSLYTNWYLSYN